MARQQARSPPSSPTGRPTSRVFKSRNSFSARRVITRRRSRNLAQASSSTGLQDMVTQIQLQESAANPGEPEQPTGDDTNPNGKRKAQVPANTGMDVDSAAEDTCPIIDRDENPFRLMDLPTEIRLEIYRACLTRPYNILLSRPAFLQYSRPRSKKIATYQRLDEEAMRDTEHVTWLVRDHAAAEGVGDQPGQRPVSNEPLPLVEQILASAIGENLQPSPPQPPAPQADSSPSSSSTLSDLDGSIDLTRPPIIYTQGSSWPSLTPHRPQSRDPLLGNILLASKEVYKEARGILYNENRFTLDIDTASSTLECLHQRSRRQIQHVELEIPSYNDILDKFQETVRLSLRYCSGLKKLVIKMPFSLPGTGDSRPSGNATVYANGFDILRWLPQHCDVIMEGNICAEIREIVNKHLHLARTLDKVRYESRKYGCELTPSATQLSYARRQLISNDTGPAALGLPALETCVPP